MLVKGRALGLSCRLACAREGRARYAPKQADALHCPSGEGPCLGLVVSAHNFRFRVAKSRVNGPARVLEENKL